MKNISLKKRNFERTAFGSEVSTGVVDPRDGFFLIIDFKERVNCEEWMREYKELVNECLLEHGVVYLKNAGIKKDEVINVVSQFAQKNSLVDSYQGGVTGRPRVDKSLFLTTSIPAPAAILQHHEMSYLSTFPKHLFFYSFRTAEHGGATPVTFSRRVKKDINPELFRQLKKRGICYIRNFFPDAKEDWHVLLSWQKAFQVETKSELVDCVKKQGFELEWLDGGQIRTKNTRPAVMVHPTTGEEFVFNHSFVLHSYSEPGKQCPARRGYLQTCRPDELKKIDELPQWDQPYLATWGDTNEPLSGDVLEELFHVYNSNKLAMNWGSGDLMIVDNILASHGRDPFLGPRETFAAFSRF